MTVRSLIKVAEKYAIDNSPTLLSAFAVTGTLATAYLTGKASFRAAKLIQAEEERRSLYEEDVLTKMGPFGTKEKALLVWTEFIPPVVSVVTTVGCVVAANSISSSRAAALAAAMTISERNFGEYKDKVKETLGIKKEQEVRDSIAQDRVTANPPDPSAPLTPGKVLCYDKWTDRYFESDMQTIRAAENDLNKGMYRGRDVCTLGDFYESIGIKAPRCSESIGWNADSSLDLTFSHALSPGGVPVLVVDFANEPFPVGGYFGTH